MSDRIFARALSIAALATALFAGTAAAQTLEGTKWTVEQEGVDGSVLWWLGSEGRVRTGDVGTILAGYRWRMSGDSLVVTVGDTVRYAAMVMSGRLVGGIRTGRGRAEGWWSAEPLSATAVAAATPTTPASSTQPMSRPTDGGVQPTSPPSTTPTTPGTTPGGGRRPIRRIEREGESSTPPSTQPTTTPTTTPGTTPTTPAPAGGTEIRRLPRPNRPGAAATTPAAASTPAATAVDAAQLIGHWIHTNPNTGITLDLRADSTFTYVRRDATTQEGRWSVDASGLNFQVDLIGGEPKVVTASLTGPVLHLKVRGGFLDLTLNRGPSGPSREPAVRQR